MSTTDFLGLNNHKIFLNVRQTLPKDIKKAKNVLTIKDDVLYTWDFQDNCILTLNIKAARNTEVTGVIPQTLLPQTPPLFTPDVLVVNESNTLLAISGTNGVMVVELPPRCPPYGAFDNNKDLIYCRGFSLHERILAFSNNVEVRQVKFYPGSLTDSHLLMLTSDNILRLYSIDKGIATSFGVYPIGIQPMARFPNTNSTFLEALGDTAIDFDFAPAQVKDNRTVSIMKVQEVDSKRSLINQALKTIPENDVISDRNNNTKEGSQLDWPIYVLYGNGEVYVVIIDLEEKGPALVRGPLPTLPNADEENYCNQCSIMCIHSNPPILCVATSNGTIYHSVVLPIHDDYVDLTREDCVNERPKYIKCPDRVLYYFECISLELGLSTAVTDVEYNCPIYLHRNLSKLDQYFASHETGLHSVTISVIENLQKFVNSETSINPDADLFDQLSTAEYLICTKTATSEQVNPVIGFTLNYEPLSLMTLLANGQLVSLPLVTLYSLPTPDNLELGDLEIMTSPLKKMLSEPFDVIIQRILKRSTTQPILKLSSTTDQNQQECYELLQRAVQIFREEHFKNHTRAREEIEKRVNTLLKLKEIQKHDLQKMIKQKQVLQGKAENLAEKYEDIKDKHEELAKRCEKLLILISKRQPEASLAEKDFMMELSSTESKVELYKSAISKLRNKIVYQELQMKNWNKQNERECVLGAVQSNAIKVTLKNMTQRVASIVKEVNEYMNQLNLK